MNSGATDHFISWTIYVSVVLKYTWWCKVAEALDGRYFPNWAIELTKGGPQLGWARSSL